MADGIAKERPEERSRDVGRDDVGLDQVLLSHAHLVEAKLGSKRLQGQRGADECAVVSDHARGERGHHREEVYPPVVDRLGRRPILDFLEEFQLHAGE